MDDGRTDEQLVTALLGGERDALAGIYDRYADALHDTAAAMLRDRHDAADVMQDVFVIAAERLGQLRDPSRLKPWLFAVLRNEVYRRTKRRRRDRPTDFSAPGAHEMAAPVDPAAEGAAATYTELAETLRGAAAGLDPRDQLVLELSVRQGLGGADLAGALGVTLDQSYILVHRMRARVERSLGAFAVARAGRKDCPDLARILSGWDGTFDVLVRKRVARHVEACDVCGETKRRYGALTLLAAAPAMAAPPELRELVLGRAGGGGGNGGSSGPDEFTAEGGFPKVARVARRGAAVLVVAAAATVALLGAGVATVLGARGGDEAGSAADVPTTTTVAPTLAAAPGPPTLRPVVAPVASTTTASPAATSTTTSTTIVTTTTLAPTTTTLATTTTTAPTIVETTTTTQPPPPPPPPPAPGQLALSSAIVELGSSQRSAVLTLTNIGGSPISWALEDGGDPAPFTWSPTGPPVLGPGASSGVQFAIDRTPLAEGAVGRSFSITTDGAGGGPVDVVAVVERAPAVRITGGPRSISCPWSVPPFVTAEAADESDLSSVVLQWSGPGSPGSTEMGQRAGQWNGRLDIEPSDGTWTYVVTATDDRGNEGSDAGSIVVTNC